MARLVMAEFRKLISTRMWRWVLLTSVVWTVTYTAIAIAINNHPGRLVPSLSSAAGQHALFATAAGFAGTLVAVMATAEVAGEYRHRTAAATFLVTPHRWRVVIDPSHIAVPIPQVSIVPFAYKQYRVDVGVEYQL